MGAKKNPVPRVDEARIQQVKRDIVKQDTELAASISQYTLDAKRNLASTYQQADVSLATQTSELQRQRGLLMQSRSQTLAALQTQKTTKQASAAATTAVGANQADRIREQSAVASFRVKGNLERRKGAANNGITY